MLLTYHGLGCFKIQSKDITIITDPYQDSVGWKLPKVKAEIVLMSDPESELANNAPRIMGEPLVISGPGEYESQGAFVYSLPKTNDEQYPMLFLIEIEDIFIAHLGRLDRPLSEKQLELIEDAHVLLLPLEKLGGEKASDVVRQVEPRIVVPMYYELPGLKVASVPLDPFAKTMGSKDLTPIEKLKIIKKDLPQEETRVIFLERS